MCIFMATSNVSLLFVDLVWFDSLISSIKLIFNFRNIAIHLRSYGELYKRVKMNQFLNGSSWFTATSWRKLMQCQTKNRLSCNHELFRFFSFLHDHSNFHMQKRWATIFCMISDYYLLPKLYKFTIFIYSVQMK